MYCDYQVYTPVMAPQIMPRPSLFNSAHLFQVFSIALDRNLNDYLKKKNLKHAQNEQKYLSVPTKVKSSEAVVIDLQSEQEMIDQVPPQEKDCHSNTLKLSSANETLSDTIQKEELVGPEEIDSISHTPAKSSVESEVMEEKALSLLCQQKWRCENDFPLFSVECPKLGISNAQLLKKRQKLLRRNVKDWNEVDCKGPKQRRQIRMLKN